MFETCDWNIEDEGPTPHPAMAEKERPSGALEKETTSRKKRLKRNRHLMEVLRTLNAPSALHPDLPLPPPEATPPKRRKRSAPDMMSPSPTEDATERPPVSGEGLSRRQWRNKVKNKRRNRNKFKVVLRTDGAGSTGKDQGEETLHQRADGKMRSPPTQAKRNGETPAEEVTPRGGSVPRTEPQRATPRERARLQKLKKLMQRETPKTPIEEHHQGTPEQPAADTSEAKEDPAAALRARMEVRLTSARFRYINEQLYTSDSQEAFRLFQRDPQAFSIYHSGFSQQVQRWPINPITGIIKYIKNRPSSLVVADFGCGDALLAQTVKNQVHSFDLVALNDRVTVCDMAAVPLADGSVDVAVFCLSLMGKNLGDFLREANRVLKLGGVLLVAEVSSRFDDVRQFLTAMSQFGFKSVNKNTENSHFFLFEFSKIRRARDASKHPGLQLKPCLYKKR
ncbi:hypothetical protein GDO78_014928 [Eleutherodactylus coqui]|uniref:Ribosomal RNA-processing protein 8 n=1 Tax=Eleutherodactylus coqui TaxID=57060 RepID=A0A8J6B2P7_ELECQ|nr:hypothetical protein GDO78_014928 [Eleutherodactylus coqui]KAG9462089.1 hypothetical protein GDO78_014928 [Eleutherodactylus coqui]